MINEELIENIKARFQQGEKASEIKDALLNEGWSEGDIDAAFTHIRHEALLQIPIYAKIHDWVKSLDQKSSELPTRTLVQIFIAISLVFIGGVILMYFILDPLGVRVAERDQKREQAAIAIRTSLEKYKKENASFPDSVAKLVPKYLATEPLDPKTNKPYSYKQLANKQHYEFCIEFEMQTVRCISSDNSSSIPVVPEVQEPTPLQSKQFAINGQIFFDTNESEKKEIDEESPEGMSVRITDETNTIVCDTVTDPSGIFNCNVAGEGDYKVTFAIPPGYRLNQNNPMMITLPTTSNAQANIETLFIGLVK